MEAVQRDYVRKLWIWFLLDSAVWRDLILALSFVLLAGRYAYIHTTPPITKITTTHEIYMPANVEMAKSVANVLQSAGLFSSVAGIAVPGITMADVAGFKSKEKEHAAIFVVLAKVAVLAKGLNNVVAVHYFGFNKSPFFIRQATEIIESPVAANEWGFYIPISLRIEANRVIVDREFSRSDRAIGLFIVACAGAIILALIISRLLSRYLWLVYKRQFLR
jgi:hypothetical protein